MKNLKIMLFRVLFCSLLLGPLDSMAQSSELKHAQLTTNATIELYRSDLEKAVPSIDEIIRDSGGVLIHQRKSIESDKLPYMLYRFQVRFKTSAYESARASIRKLGKVIRETLEADMTKDTIDLTIVLTDNRRRSAALRATKVFAGVSAAAVNVNLGNNFKRSILGAGVTLTPENKWAYMTILVLRDAKEDDVYPSDSQEPRASGSSMLLIGHNYYSSVFGNGENTFLNPIAGVNYGLTRLYNRTMLTVGGTLGIELVSTEWFTLSAAAKVNGLYGAHDGGTSTIYEAQLSMPF